jgi:hypothetical protein
MAALFGAAHTKSKPRHVESEIQFLPIVADAVKSMEQDDATTTGQAQQASGSRRPSNAQASGGPAASSKTGPKRKREEHPPKDGQKKVSLVFRPDSLRVSLIH